MILNNIIISIRHIIKSKWIGIMNILGLSIGFCAATALLTFVAFETNYDSFHTNKDLLYRFHLGEGIGNPNVLPALGPALEKSLPEIDKSVRIKYDDGVLEAKNRQFRESRLCYVDQYFLDVFSYDLIRGSSTTVLAEPGSIVLSQSMAKKYFGELDILGETIEFLKQGKKSKIFTVTGVLEDVPANSHLKFDFLVSYNTLPESREDYMYGWSWFGIETYVLLNSKETDPREVESKFQAFIKPFKDLPYNSVKNVSNMSLIPVEDVHLLNLPSPEYGNLQTIRFLAALAIVIVLIVLSNFVNLTIAQASVRRKEVGMRKIIGASKVDLIKQFGMESLIISLVSVICAFSIFHVFSQYFEGVSGLSFKSVSLLQNPVHYLLLGSLFVAISFLCYLYPVSVISNFEPIKTISNLKTSKYNFSTRNTLVFFQLIIGIALVGATVVIKNQMNYVHNKNLGISIDNTLIIKPPLLVDENRSDVSFKTKINQLSYVKSVSASETVPGQSSYSSYYGVKIVGRAKDNSNPNNVPFVSATIDENFIESYKLPIIKGAAFSNNIALNKTSVIINRQAAKELGINDEADPIGLSLKIMRHEYEIVGITEDYHQASLTEDYTPMMFLNGGIEYPYFSIKLDESSFSPERIKIIKNIWEESFPGNLFESYVLADQYSDQYNREQQFASVISGFSLLAIIIVFMGSIGLITFIVKKKQKEFAIRKITGSSTMGLMYLVIKKYIGTVIFSAPIALPLVYWFSIAWKKHFVFQSPLNVNEYILPVIFILITVLLSISYHVFKLGYVNIASVLKE